MAHVSSGDDSLICRVSTRQHLRRGNNIDIKLVPIGSRKPLLTQPSPQLRRRSNRGSIERQVCDLRVRDEAIQSSDGCHLFCAQQLAPEFMVDYLWHDGASAV